MKANHPRAPHYLPSPAEIERMKAIIREENRVHLTQESDYYPTNNHYVPRTYRFSPGIIPAHVAEAY